MLGVERSGMSDLLNAKRSHAISDSTIRLSVYLRRRGRLIALYRLPVRLP